LLGKLLLLSTTAEALVVGRPAPLARRARCEIAASAQAPNTTAGLALLERIVAVANLEAHAEECEAAGDLGGAIAAYESLLELQPPTSPGLSAEIAARRGLQELFLQSAKRELAACEEEGCDISFFEQAQRAGEETRKQLASRALADVGRIRDSIIGLLERSTAQAQADVDRAREEQAYLRLVEGNPAFLASWQLEEAQRRVDDTTLLRKSIESDLNRLELQLLAGDPSLTFLRELLKATRREPEQHEEIGSLWLEEQFESGALPRDPELMRTLLEQARRDPELVTRLVTQAKDREGKDIFTRRQNVLPQKDGLINWEQLMGVEGLPERLPDDKPLP